MTSRLSESGYAAIVASQKRRWLRKRGTDIPDTPRPEYRAWSSMLNRCENRNNRAYERYGARGIGVCERWRSFRNFFQDMGERPSTDHSIDRIDNNGNYEPTNCRWATRLEQGRNKRNSRLVELDGITKPLPEWAEEYGLDVELVRARLRRGWSSREALTRTTLTREARREF